MIRVRFEHVQQTRLPGTAAAAVHTLVWYDTKFRNTECTRYMTANAKIHA